jgi:hypothetical protein
LKYLATLFIAAFACLSFTLPDGPQTIADTIRLNQIQVIASHNSYHLRSDKRVLQNIQNLYNIGIIPRELNPKELDYSHATLTEQLTTYGIRGVELDIYNDPQGGNFYRRQGRALVGLSAKSHIEELKKPGFKMLHIPDVDYNTNNYTFVSALTEIKKWSDAHPGHLPVFINIEPKSSAIRDKVKILRRFAKSIPYDSVAYDNMDKEIKSVFGEDLPNVITPDRVRGNYVTLEKAIRGQGWPTLASCRGKVIFIIDGSSELYIKGHPSFRGRAMFAYVDAGTPEAAFVKLNDPIKHGADIQQRVKEGYIIRTRADEGTIEARTGDYTTQRAAFASWGQIVSTDYYRPDERAGKKKGWSDYHVPTTPGYVTVDSIAAPELYRQAKQIKE